MVSLARIKKTARAANCPRLPLFSVVQHDERVYTRDEVTLFHGDALDFYGTWPTPTVIISDGAYGLGRFPGDPHTHDELAAWYHPHIEKWAQYSTPQTTLWFWNSEQGWATVHPILLEHGWRFVNCHIWDKGLSHVAGNSNTKTLRKFPVASEVCVQYVKEARIDGLSLRDWLRREWERTGLPYSQANQATGTKNAGTRKYLTKDHLWYFPPADAFGKLVEYCNVHGDPTGQPYFSADGVRPLSALEWEELRAKFYCKLGVTNVWREPAVNGSERVKLGTLSVHLNQKPLRLTELLIETSSDPGDTVWEPFGGLCTAAVAALILKRRCVGAETYRDFFELAVERLRSAG